VYPSPNIIRLQNQDEISKACMGEEWRGSYRVLVWKPDGKKPLG